MILQGHCILSNIQRVFLKSVAVLFRNIDRLKFISMATKVHSCTFELHLHRVQIQIKFPCRLTFSFKVGHQQVTSPEEAKLQNNQTAFPIPVTLSAKVPYSATLRRYTERKGILTVFVISNTGQNIAGVCSIDIARALNEKYLAESTQLPLQRCPDRNACLNIRLKAVFLQEATLNQSDSGSLFADGIFEREIEGSSFAGSTGQSRKECESDLQSFKGSPASKSSKKLNSKPPKPYTTYPAFRTRVDSVKERMRVDRDSSNQEQINRSHVVMQLKSSLTEKDRRVTKLEMEKQVMERQLSSLKRQLQGARAKTLQRGNRQVELQSENERLRRKLSDQSRQVQQLRASKLQQLLSKQTVSTPPATSPSLDIDQLVIRSQRVEELEQQLRVCRKSNEELERLSREARRQARQSIQKVEDLKNSQQTLQRRLQMKQIFYKEEIKKYSQRVAEIQASRRQLSTQTMILKEKHEESERKLETSIRQREKAANQEKNKLKRASEDLQLEIQKLKIELSDRNKKALSLNDTIKNLEGQLLNCEDENKKQRQQIQGQRKSALQREQHYARQIQEQLNLREQENKVRLKDRQKETQSIVLQKQREVDSRQKELSEKVQLIRTLNGKISELDKKLMSKSQEVLQLEQDKQTLERRLQAAKRLQQKLIRDLQEVKSLQKASKTQIQKQQLERHQIVKKAEDQKARNQAALEQLRGTVKSLNEQVERLKMQLHHQIQSSNRLTEDLEHSAKKVKALNTECEQFQGKIKQAEQQLLEVLKRQKSLQDECSRLSGLISEQKEAEKREVSRVQEVYAKLQQQNQESLRLQLKLEQLEHTQKILREKQSEMKSLLERETVYEVELQKRQYELEELKAQLTARTGELDHQKSRNEQLRREAAASKQEMMVLEGFASAKQDQLQKEILDLRREVNNKKTIIERTENTLSETIKHNEQVNSRLKEFIIRLFEHHKTSTEMGPQSSYHQQPQMAELERELLRKASSLRHYLQDQFQQKTLEQEKSHQKHLAELQQQLRKEKDSLEALRESSTALQQDYKFYKESAHMREESFEQQVRQLNGDIEALQDDLDTKIRQLAVLNQHYQEIQQQLAGSNSALNDKQKKLLQEQLQIERLSLELQALTAANKATMNSLSEEHLQQLQSRDKVFKQQLQKLQHDIREKAKLIDHTSTEAKSLSKQLEAKQDLIRGLERKNQQLRQQYSLKVEEADLQAKREQQLLTKCRQLEQEVGFLTEELQLAGQKNSHLEQALSQYDSNKNTLQGQLADALKQNQQVQSRLNELQRKRIQLQQTLQKKCTDYDQLQSELNQLGDSFKRSVSMEEYNRILDSYRQLEAQSSQRQKQLQLYIQGISKDIQSERLLRQNLLDEEKLKRQAQIQRLKNQEGILRAKQRRSSMTLLEQIHRQKDSMLGKMQEQVNLKTSLNRQLQQALAKTKSQLDDAKNQLSREANEKKFLQSRLKSYEGKDAQMNTLQEAASKNSQAIHILEQEIIRRNGEVARMKENYDRMTNQNQKLLQAKEQMQKELESCIAHFTAERLSLETSYDREVRELTNRILLVTQEAEDKVKKIFQQKIEGEKVLHQDIEILKDRLERISRGLPVPSLSRTSLETEMEDYGRKIVDVRMDLYQTERSLRETQTLIIQEGWTIESLLEVANKHNVNHQLRQGLSDSQVRLKEIQAMLKSSVQQVQSMASYLKALIDSGSSVDRKAREVLELIEGRNYQEAREVVLLMTRR